MSALDAFDVVVSAVTNISNGKANLTPFAPHSSPNKDDNVASSSPPDNLSRELEDESSLPKSRVIFHVPGDHGEADVLREEDIGCCEDDMLRLVAHLIVSRREEHRWTPFSINIGVDRCQQLRLSFDVLLSFCNL